MLETLAEHAACDRDEPSLGHAFGALRDARAAVVKIRFNVTVTLTPSSWAAWAGIDESQVRRDVIEYITSSLPDLPGLCQTDAILRWREISALQAGARLGIRAESPWPMDRDGE